MFRAWLQAVDNLLNPWENYRTFSTASTAVPLNISHNPVFIPNLSATFSQAGKLFTQLIHAIFYLLGWLIYTLSTASTEANKHLINY